MCAFSSELANEYVFIEWNGTLYECYNNSWFHLSLLYAYSSLVIYCVCTSTCNAYCWRTMLGAIANMVHFNCWKSKFCERDCDKMIRSTDEKGLIRNGGGNTLNWNVSAGKRWEQGMQSKQ